MVPRSLELVLADVDGVMWSWVAAVPGAAGVSGSRWFGAELMPAVPLLPDSAPSKEASGLPGLGVQSEQSWGVSSPSSPRDPVGLPVCLPVCPPPGEHSALVWGADGAGVHRALLPPGLPGSARCLGQQQPWPTPTSPGLPAGMQSPPGAAAWLVQARGGTWPGCCSSALGPWAGQGGLSEAVSSRGHGTPIGQDRRRQDAFAKLPPPDPHPLHPWAPDLVTPASAPGGTPDPVQTGSVQGPPSSGYRNQPSTQPIARRHEDSGGRRHAGRGLHQTLALAFL